MATQKAPEVITGEGDFKKPDPAPVTEQEPAKLTKEDKAALKAADAALTPADKATDAKVAAKDASASEPPAAAPPNTPVQPHGGPSYVGKVTGHSTSIETGEPISFPMEFPTPVTEEGAFRAFKTYQPSASREAFVIDPENKTDHTLRQSLDNGVG